MADKKAEKKVSIKLKVSLAGERKAFAPGEVVEWEEEDAKRLIEAGHAELVKEK